MPDREIQSIGEQSGFQSALDRLRATIEAQTQDDLDQAKARNARMAKAQEQKLEAEKPRETRAGRFLEAIKACGKSGKAAADVIESYLCARFEILPIAAFQKEAFRCIRDYGFTETINAAIITLRSGPEKVDEPFSYLAATAKRLNEMGK